jgi:ferrous-iron efflux pump FieF
MSVQPAPMRPPETARALNSGDLNRRAALASVAAAVLLAGLKVYALWQTGSIAMLGALADTALDLLASLVTLLGVRVAAQPADIHHRFGHGKAESLAALFQVALISMTAMTMIVRSADRLRGGAAPTDAETGIAVSIFAIIVTLALVAYQRSIIRQTRSIAISTDSVHYQSDLLLNSAVIAALALESFAGIHGADAMFGIVIGLWLGWGAWTASTHAIGQLMDKEWPLERREQFLAVASRHPELQGIHDMRTRTSGAQDFVQFHMWVDPDMTVLQAHRVMDEVEAKLRAEFPGVEILIHPDPVGHVDRNDPLAAVDAQALVADIRSDKEPD